MAWTAKTILGLVLLFNAWFFGWWGLNLLSRVLDLGDPKGFRGVLIVGIYGLSGPVSWCLWIRWMGRRAGEAHADRTRDHIGALRVTVRSEEPHRGPRNLLMGRVDGLVKLSRLPPNCGLILNLCFYPVSGADAPPPHRGKPPASAAKDTHKVFEDVHLERESTEKFREIPVQVVHSQGWNYLEVRVILFRTGTRGMLAQAEQFMMAHALQIADDPSARATFPVEWPEADPETLPSYGTVYPQ